MVVRQRRRRRGDHRRRQDLDRRRLLRPRRCTTCRDDRLSRTTSAAPSRTTARSASPAPTGQTPAARLGRGRGGRGGRRAYSAGGAEPGYIAPDPLDPDVFFSGGTTAASSSGSTAGTGEPREVNPYPRMFSGEPSSALVERWQWTLPDHLLAGEPAACSTPRRSTCGRPPTAGRAGTGSAPISRATTPRPWAPRAARSRTT